MNADDLDRKIAHALAIDGRAPFSTIGSVLGTSDQTIARRYAALRASGAMRVIGLPDTHLTGGTAWLLRIRCTPDAAGAVGAALARRDDTSWVTMINGGTELSAVLRPGDTSVGDAFLLNTLPRTRQVVGLEAHALLHLFFGRDQSPLTRSGPLTAEQVAALAPPDAPEPAADTRVSLDEGDRRLLATLAVDGRAAIGELAAATGWSPTTVRRRLSQLRRSGALYFDIDMSEQWMRPAFRAELWFDIEPARLAEAGAAIAGHPEIAFAAAITGAANLYASLVCPDATTFYRYLTGPAAALPGVRGIETVLRHRLLKGPGPLLNTGPGRP